jgi:hypothetical protein
VLTDAATTMRRKLGLLEREAPPPASCNCPAPHATLESWEAAHGPMDAELWPNGRPGCCPNGCPDEKCATCPGHVTAP